MHKNIYKNILTMIHLEIGYYQQSGDAKKLYFLQYSAVVSEVAPVKASYTTIKDNMPIKKRLKPLKANFNAFLIEFFVTIEDNIIIITYIVSCYI
ncbi:MAG TPA: hypothetical protein VE307_06500 [Nitrososphaeraceae archaeon]|nr:hypothetical protein [Nitrososphaeraceae archaeon]